MTLEHERLDVYRLSIGVTVHGVGKCAFLNARACTRFLTRSLLREKAHVPARAPARKARAGTRTQNGRHSTRIAYDNTRERLPQSNEIRFRRWLDRQTDNLLDVLPINGRPWGAARKAINLFLRDVLYNQYLSGRLPETAGDRTAAQG
jgi:hypothetical protein